MKNFITYLLLLGCITISTAQSHPISLEDLKNNTNLGITNNDWRLDSIYNYHYGDLDWVKNNKSIVMDRNIDNHITQFDHYATLSSQDIVTSKEERAYYNEDQMHYQFTGVWDQASSAYIDTLDYVLYDENNNILKNLYKGWDAVNDVPIWGQKEDHTYSATNKLTSSVICDLTIETNTWANTEKQMYSYSSADLLERTDKFIWEQNIQDWQPLEQKLYAYDNEGTLKSLTIKLYNTSTQSFVPKERFVYEYEGNMTVQVQQFYQNEDWVNSKRDIDIYDTNGIKIQSLQETWHNGNQDFTPHKERTYATNTNGDYTQIHYKKWNYTTNQYQSTFKWAFTYNSDYNLMEVIVSSFDPQTDSWAYSSKTEYFYTPTSPTSTEAPPVASVKIFPNPVEHMLYFEGNIKINVYSSIGQLMINQQNTQNSIDIRHLDKGAYIVVLHTDQGISSHSIVKQ